jgi:predicted CXXCH cytochrome family protein
MVFRRALALSPIAVCLVLGAVARGSAAEVLWIYPPPNSLVSASPAGIFGYVLGPPEPALDAKVVSGDPTVPPTRHSLYLFKGKVFSGSVELQPGRNNVVVGDSVLPLLYRPGFEGDRDGEFRRPNPHGEGLESCSPCHAFQRGELILKDTIPDLCLGCHEVGTESLRAALRENQHTRTITPDCLRCHDPHASFEPMLLRTGENLCTPCHEPQGGVSRHAVAAPSCSACHDPHASAYPGQLKGEGLKLCQECHREIADPRRYPRSYHRPAQDRRCFDCHMPHAGPIPANLKAGVPELCRECHSPQESAGHEGELDECRLCHASHLSQNRALLKEGVAAVCDSCHGGFPEGVSNHPGLRDGCVACHDPHRVNALKEQARSCGGCHSNRDDDFRGAHGTLPISEVRQCTFCHEPHRSNYESLLRGNIHYPLRNGGCSACHEAKQGKVGLRYEGSHNCMRCHGQITGTSQIIETDKVHKPVFQIDCIACHNPHMGVRDSFLLEEPVTLCGWCHGILLRGVENLHGVFREGGSCYTCHLPHISDFRPLLKQREGELCTKCHTAVLPEDRAAQRLLHGALREGPCSGCHNPHGTNTERLLQGRRDTLCRECHPGVLKDREGEGFRYVHGPVGAGNCSACHELSHRHRERDDAFLKTERYALCDLCHSTGRDHVPERYRSKMREVGNYCLACHLPHGADNPFLIRSSD